MKITSTKLVGLKLIEPKIFNDERGLFFESYHKQIFSENDLSTEFVQDNHSRSKQGTLRGMHYQIRQPQGKLLRVTMGKIYDVAVDLRKSSPTFRQWMGLYLSAENKQELFIPPGFAHGFYVVSEWADVIYKATDYYAPQWERTILWNDVQINVAWPLLDGIPLLLSPKDANGKTFDQAEVYD
jgi:dTDP-4-dehydrorhamnose 3,5-epimerase